MMRGQEIEKVEFSAYELTKVYLWNTISATKLVFTIRSCMSIDGCQRRRGLWATRKGKAGLD